MKAAPLLPPALPGSRISFESDAGQLTLYSSGSGQRPLLLVHSINAAASSAEVRPIYERYCSRRSTYALDLPGFGLSERSDRPYTVRLMTDAIHAAVARIQRECGGQKVDVLGVSLSC